MFFLPPATAQKKYIYQDSSLLQKEEELVVPDNENTEPVPVEQIIDAVKKNPADEKTDTSLYQNDVRLSSDSIEQWKDLKEFAYVKYLDSLLKDKKANKKTDLKESSDTGMMNRFLNSRFLSILLWTLAVCFVLFIIYRLFLADGVFRRETRSTGIKDAEAEEEVLTNESDFDAFIKQSLQSGNYRLAIRYQYLKTLHTLSGKKYIELAPDKTNFQYVHEIVNREYQNEFAELTLHYEYVWYGEFAIEKNIYQKLETNFNSLNKKL